MDSAYLFVYGTLRQASRHPMAERLRERATYAGAAWVPGRLFDLGPFPGLVEATRPGDWVKGDLFHLHDVAILAELDHYEGLTKCDAAPGLFERVQVVVTDEKKTSTTAWLYRYRGPLTDARQIMHGDYSQRKD